jgi:hypothetical protein
MNIRMDDTLCLAWTHERGNKANAGSHSCLRLKGRGIGGGSMKAMRTTLMPRSGQVWPLRATDWKDSLRDHNLSLIVLHAPFKGVYILVSHSIS